MGKGARGKNLWGEGIWVKSHFKEQVEVKKITLRKLKSDDRK